MKDELAYLEQRLALGDRYLEAHPEDTHARAGYYRYMERYVSLSLTNCGIKVHLALPDGVTWSPDKDSPPQSVVIVALEGEPGPGELSRAGLAALVETIDEAAAAAEGE